MNNDTMELLDSAMQVMINESRKEGNFNLTLVFPTTIKFENIEETKNKLTEYFKSIMYMDKVFKVLMWDTGYEYAGIRYNLHFKSEKLNVEEFRLLYDFTEFEEVW